MSAQLEPGTRVVTPSGIKGTYRCRMEAPNPEWNWATIVLDDDREFFYPVWLLKPLDMEEESE